MLLYALQHDSHHTFSAHTMLPYHLIAQVRDFGGMLIVPGIIGAVSLDQ